VTAGPRPSGADAPEGSSFSLSRELARKALHLATVSVPIAYHYGLPSPLIVAVLGAGSGIALAVEFARRSHPATRALFEKLVGQLLRPHERSAITGATWLCLSCFAAVVLLPAPAAIAAMWCATIGDPSAAIVGRMFATASGGKTWQGSFACILTSALGVWWLTPLSLLAALAVGVVAALAERPARPFDDNLRVVTVAGLAALALA
jgi:dolichol kinase